MTTPRTHTPASGSPNGLDALLQQAQGAGQRTGVAPDGAAFQRWMQQYRQPDVVASPQPVPDARPATLAASHAAQPGAAGRSPTARDSLSRDAHLQAREPSGAESERAATAPPPGSGPGQAPANRPPSKELRKQATQGRAPEPGRTAQASGTAQPEPEGKALADADEAGDAVRFQTAQGEATAWVKELPVPDDIAAGDPAAMLAWLASLHSPAQAGAHAMGAAQAEAATDARSAGGLLQPADQATWGGRGPTGAEALTLQALQRGSADGGLGQGRSQGEGAEAGREDGGVSLQSLGLAEASGTTADASAASFAAALQRELQPMAGPRADGPVRHYTGNLHTPMDSPAFTQALTDRVAFWVNGPAAEGPMTAELRLNPAEMGPVHIRIELDGQNAHVDFAAAAAETREAIEASLGQLSSALEESGLKLSGGGVSDQTPQQQAWAQATGQSGSGQGGAGRQARNPEGRWASAGVAEGMSESLGAVAPRPGRAGGLDLYA